MKFSVSVHYLLNSVTYSTQILPMDMSKECTVQVRIWSWFDDFWQSFPLLTLRKGNFQFTFIISPTVVHIQQQIKDMDMS
jgi:hypothetical protein